jgi:hypothetical protein
MKKTISIYSLLFCLFPFWGISQQAQWAKWFAGVSGSKGKQIQADDAGNVYSFGSYGYSLFQGPVDLDPGPGVVAFTQPENTGSFYISKLNPNGNLIWVRSFTNSSVGSAGVEKLVLLPNGDFLIAGVFGGTVDFNLNAGVFNLTSNSTNNANSDAGDFFIAKYNASGNFLWVKSFSCLSNGVIPNSPTVNGVGGLSLDNQNNILFTGTFKGQVDMNIGPGEQWIESFGNYNAFWVKLTSTGDFIQGQHIANGTNASTSILSDEFNNIYLHGIISQSVYFGAVNPENFINSYSWSDSYILKMNSNGERIWLNKIHGPQYGYGGSTDISVDEEGNVYATGNILRDSLYFKSANESQFLLKSNSFTETGNNAFVTKIDSNGHYVWIKHMVSNSALGVTGNLISCDSINNVYVCGQLSDSAQFDVSVSSSVSYATGDYSGFVAKYNADGDFIRTSIIDGDRYVNLSHFSLDRHANIYFTGFFYVVNLDPGFPWAVIVGTGQIDFDSGPDTLPIIGLGNSPETVFVAKWSQCSAGSDTLTETACNAYVWQGESLSESGPYRKSLTTAERCDSISVLQLTINTSTAAEQNLRICAGESVSVGNETYTSSGTYIQTLSNQSGCDSMLTTILMVDTVSAEISLSDNTFTTINPPVNATFQWLNCDANFSMIAGAINSEFIATEDGNYAVEINSENCRDTSNCILFSSVGLHSISSNQLRIYPIPADETLFIESEFSNSPIRIFDAQGRLVFETITSSKPMEIDVRLLQSGLYFMQSDNTSQPFTILHNR